MKAICDLNYDEVFLEYFPNCNSCEEFLLKNNYHLPINDCCRECDFNYVNKIKRYDCKHHKFYATQGTFFYRSSTPLHKWFYAIYLIQKNPKITVENLKKSINVTYKTAWRIKHLIIENFDEIKKLKLTFN